MGELKDRAAGLGNELAGKAKQAAGDVTNNAKLKAEGVGQEAKGKAQQVAEVLEIDAVIDPADTRSWLVKALRACGEVPPQKGKKRPFVDVW